MKAILIDVIAKTVSMIDVAKDPDAISAIQKMVGGYAQPVDLNPRNTLWIDEEGLLKNPENFFVIKYMERVFPQALAGNGLILGLSAGGVSQDTSLSLTDIRVEFFTKGQLEILGVRTEPHIEVRFF